MKKLRDSKLNNAGISLVEVIIVLAIMGIIGGAVLLSTSVATNKQVNSCAEKLASSLEQTRNLVMGKQSGFLRVWQDPGDYVYIQMYIDGKTSEYKFSDEVAIGKPGVTVNYTLADGSTGVLTAGTPIDIGFLRNGSVSKATGFSQVKQFEITNGNRVVVVNIDQFTGRIETVKTA